MSELRTSTLVRFVVRHGSWVCLLPIPLWLLFRIALEPQAAWYARYVSANPKEAPVERFEKALSHYWTGSKEVIEIAPVSPQHVEATFDTCLSADEPVEVPVMLVAAGSARLLVNQHVVLELASSSEHATIGKRWTIPAGVHQVRVEFKGSSKPVIGLLASFDGSPPSPIGSGNLAPSVTTFRPNGDPRDCQR